MQILVGGQSLAIQTGDTSYQGDWDWWVTEGDGKDLKGTKLDINVMPDYIMQAANDCIELYGKMVFLKTIKLSHMQYDIFWFKHHKLILDKFRGVMVDWYFFDLMSEYWKVKHGDKSFLSLKRSKDEFFTDNVEYKYDHDWLHELVAYPNKPVYSLCLKDNEQVLVDKDRFFMLQYDQQLRMFREEITVIAVERWLLSDKVSSDMTFSKAYRLALRKTCTTLTKGWASRFILEHIEELSKPDVSLIFHLMQHIPLGGIMAKLIKPEDFIKEVFGDILHTNKCKAYSLTQTLVNDGAFGDNLNTPLSPVYCIAGNYYRFEMSDNSYGGDTTLDEIYKVTPVPKQITDFE